MHVVKFAKQQPLIRSAGLKQRFIRQNKAKAVRNVNLINDFQNLIDSSLKESPSKTPRTVSVPHNFQNGQSGIRADVLKRVSESAMPGAQENEGRIAKVINIIKQINPLIKNISQAKGSNHVPSPPAASGVRGINTIDPKNTKKHLSKGKRIVSGPELNAGPGSVQKVQQPNIPGLLSDVHQSRA